MLASLVSAYILLIQGTNNTPWVEVNRYSTLDLCQKAGRAGLLHIDTDGYVNGYLNFTCIPTEEDVK